MVLTEYLKLREYKPIMIIALEIKLRGEKQENYRRNRISSKKMTKTRLNEESDEIFENQHTYSPRIED